MGICLENTIRKALAKNPYSMMEAAHIAKIPYGIFVRCVIELGIYQKDGLVCTAAINNRYIVLQAAKVIGVPFMPIGSQKRRLDLSQPGRAGDSAIKFKYIACAFRPLEEILQGYHPGYHKGTLKRRLLASGIKENRCEACGLGSAWLGKPLVLALDHVDGDSTNHRFINIRMLCPNCHSQTDTYCGRNANQNNQKSVTDEALVEALHNSNKISEALRAVGLVGSETWYKRARRLIDQHNLDHLMIPTRQTRRAEPSSCIQLDTEKLKKERHFLEQQKYVRQVLLSGINFRQEGWINLVAPLINQEPQAVHEWMQTFMPDFYVNKCRKPTPDNMAAADLLDIRFTAPIKNQTEPVSQTEHSLKEIQCVRSRTARQHARLRHHKYSNPQEYHRARHEQYIAEQKPFIDIVMRSGIDFSKHGWVTAVAPLINQKPQKVHKWMQTVMPEFYKEQCFKRKSAKQPRAA